MPIEIAYDSLDMVPEAHRELYEDRDGKAVLTGVVGMKTQADIDGLRGALEKERNDHRAAAASLKAWGDRKPEEVLAQLDRVKELELAAEGNIDEDKMNQILEGRMAQVRGPLERQIEEVSSTNTTLLTENTALKAQIDSRDRNDQLRVLGNEMKIHSTAIADLELAAGMMLERDDQGNWITKSDVPGITPGVDTKQFMREMQKLRPHWWPASEGGGAGGSGGGVGGGTNPWMAKSWNLTEQGQIVREQGSATAERLAKAAGTTVGGLRPAAK